MRKSIADVVGKQIVLDEFQWRRSLGLDSNGLPIYPIKGSDQLQGYNTEGDLVTVTADGRDLNAMWTEFQQTLEIWNERRQQLINLLTFPVTALIEDVPQVGDAEFEMATEFGEPVGIRTGLTYFSLGYDFHDYDMAVRYTWKFLRDADARQVEAIHQQALNADNRMVFRKVMEAIFDNRNRATSIRQQNIPVYPLYNNDGTVPPTYKNNTFAGSHNHYMVSNAATIDSGDFEAAYDNIAEHGFGLENGSQFVIMAPKAMVKEMRKWRMGVANNNSVVANYDFIPSPTEPALIVPNAEGLLGSRPPATWNGFRVSGSYGDVLIIEEDYIPTGYFLMFATGGAGNLQNIVGLREHANPQYRGLRLLPGNNQRYPLVDSYYSRGFGTGIRQRGGAVVMQIKASGSYDLPTAYTRGGGLG
jgi:hypothetical protein